jgi:Leucine-rich repeat (LRR) protein
MLRARKESLLLPGLRQLSDKVQFLFLLLSLEGSLSGLDSLSLSLCQVVDVLQGVLACHVFHHLKVELAVG